MDVEYNRDGSVAQLKARSVVFSNHQVKSIDYTETFAPMARMTTIRTLSILAAKIGHCIRWMFTMHSYMEGCSGKYI